MVYCTSCGTEALYDAVFCSKCGKPIQPASNSVGIVQRRSRRWYLLPIFFDIIGGVICYYALRHDDKKLAQNCLKLGIILFLINIGVVIAVGTYYEYEREKNPGFDAYLGCSDCNNQISIVPDSGSSASAPCVTANNCYSPNPLTIPSGTTVTWTNKDTSSHTVTSGNVADNTAGTMYDSGLVKPGGTFQFTFANPGTFDYFCTVHPWMTGHVIVER